MSTTSAAATIGACTKKIARQSKSWVRTPPSAGPIATPTAPAIAHQRRARSPAIVPSTGSDPASSRVAPTPWAHRAASRRARLLAKPATSEAAANTATPATTSESGRTRLWRRATGTATTATTRAYVVSTQETPTIDVSNSA